MGTDYEAIFASKIFKFIVGPDQTEFFLHGAAVSSISKPLGKMLNGSMKEAQEGQVVWDDLDEKTFVRFSQWIYTGNYFDLEPDILLDASQIATSHNTADSGIIKLILNEKPSTATNSDNEALYSVASLSTTTWDNSSTCESCGLTDYMESNCSDRHCSQCKGIFKIAYCGRCGRYESERKCSSCRPRKSSRAKMATLFNTSTDYEFQPPYGTPNMPFTPRKNTEVCEEYSNVFISHARLYVLADKYDIEKLRDLALHKLWASLKEFTLYTARVNDITGVIMYAFETFSDLAYKDKMCNMLVHYSACIFEDLVKSDDFQTLVQELPVFTFGALKKINERLTSELSV